MSGDCLEPPPLDGQVGSALSSEEAEDKQEDGKPSAGRDSANSSTNSDRDFGRDGDGARPLSRKRPRSSLASLTARSPAPSLKHQLHPELEMQDTSEDGDDDAEEDEEEGTDQHSGDDDYEVPPPPHLGGGEIAFAGAHVSVVSMQEKWDEMFNRLIHFKEIHGHCLVPNRYKEDTSLGSWVATQRRTYKNMMSGQTASSGMNMERARRLGEIGFEWSTTDPRHRPWEERYEELKAFVTANGHAEVPMRWEKNVQLSNWVSKQRQDYKLLQRGKTTRLTEKRRKLLNDVGFVWEIPRKGRRLRVLSKKVVNPASGTVPPVVTTSGSSSSNNHKKSSSSSTAVRVSAPSTSSATGGCSSGRTFATTAMTKAAVAVGNFAPNSSTVVAGGENIAASVAETLLSARQAPGITASAFFPPPAAPPPPQGPLDSDSVLRILGALGTSTNNVHIANVVALAQLILNAQQQQQPSAAANIASASLGGQGQQQDNINLMNIVQGMVQASTYQQQHQQQDVSAASLQSIATAIITAQLGTTGAGNAQAATVSTHQPSSTAAAGGEGGVPATVSIFSPNNTTFHRQTPLNSLGNTSIQPSRTTKQTAEISNAISAHPATSSSGSQSQSQQPSVQPWQPQLFQFPQQQGTAASANTATAGAAVTTSFGGQQQEQPTFVLLPLPMNQTSQQQQQLLPLQLQQILAQQQHQQPLAQHPQSQLQFLNPSLQQHGPAGGAGGVLNLSALANLGLSSDYLRALGLSAPQQQHQSALLPPALQQQLLYEQLQLLQQQSQVSVAAAALQQQQQGGNADNTGRDSTNSDSAI